MTQRKTYPRGLKAHGKAVWDNVVDNYTIDPAETVVLEQLCKTIDQIDAIDAEMSTMGIIVAGSKGQPTVNGLIRARMDLVKLVDQLSRSLSLPVGNETQGRRRSPEVRAAAKSGGRPKVPGRLRAMNRIDTHKGA